MEKFLISFRYNDQKLTATVTKSSVGRRTDYAVHPTSPLIISRFGSEILLFREEDDFAVNTSKDDSYQDFVDVVATAIRDRDSGPGSTEENPNRHL
jgi:hypothetical protein